VNVATSAETGPTVPKDTAAADRRTAVRAMTGVEIRETARTVPAARGAAPDNGGTATIVAVMTAAQMLAAVTTAGAGRGETTTAANVAEMTADSSQAAGMIAAAPVADRDAAAARADSARVGAARPSARSAATLAPTSRTSLMRSRPASSSPRFVATC